MSDDTTSVQNSMIEPDILVQLRTEDENEVWCGEGGLFQRAADEIERLRIVLASIVALGEIPRADLGDAIGFAEEAIGLT